MHAITRRLLAILVAAVFAAAVTADARAGGPVFAWPDDGSIVFQSAGQLWLIDPVRRVPRKLGVLGTAPAWSHRGDRIAYSTGSGFQRFPGTPHGQILIVDWDGSGLRTVTTGAGDFEPTWWTDDSVIFHSSDRVGRSLAPRASVYDSREIWEVNTNGTAATPYRQYFPGSWWDQPDFSPRTNRIAFLLARWDRFNGQGVIDRRIGITPPGPGQPVVDLGSGQDPSWSPDGAEIAFTGLDGEIYVMKADGTARRRLTFSSAADAQPTWSHDGRRIAFSSNRDGDFEIYMMSSTGGAAVRVTDNTVDDTGPDWSPVARLPTKPPVVHREFVVRRTAGRVFLAIPPGGFGSLSEARRAPLGSTVDATDGEAEVFAGSDEPGRVSAAYVSGGAFQVTQLRADGTPQITPAAGAGRGKARCSRATLRVDLRGGEWRARGRSSTVSAAGGAAFTAREGCGAGTSVTVTRGRVRASGIATQHAIAAGGSFAAYCSASGDWCANVTSRGRSARFKLGSFAFDRARLCVTDPANATTCLDVRLARPDRFDIRRADVNWRTAFPYRGAGRYTARWHVGDDPLGPALAFTNG